jgi:hypothetical protein
VARATAPRAQREACLVSQLEPYLSDIEVHEVQSRLYEEFPQLIAWNTDFVTTRIEPPWYGQLPDGTTGRTTNPVVQFLIVSDHPRPIQRLQGARHGTVASAWQQAFESAVKEQKHLVVGDKKSPLETVFRMVLIKHIEEMASLKSIINDAVSDPSKPKSALDAL